jgi:hypothetical protein
MGALGSGGAAEAATAGEMAPDAGSAWGDQAPQDDAAAYDQGNDAAAYDDGGGYDEEI